MNSAGRRSFWLYTLALVAFLALVCAPTVALADNVTMKLEQPTTTTNPNGVYVDPYPILINGVTTTLLACDDYNTHISVGEQWNANRYLLGDLDSSLADTPKFSTFGTAITNDHTFDDTGYSVLQMYQAVALLTLDLLSNPANEIVDSYAIWDIFDGPPQNVAGALTLAENTLINVKSGGVSTNTLSWLNQNVYIYTAIPPDGSQEFIGLVPDSGVTLMLLGAALVGLEGLRRRFGV